MAIAYKSQSASIADGNASANATLSPALPTGWAVGDFALAWMWIDWSFGCNYLSSGSPPSGWTWVADAKTVFGSTGGGIRVWYRFLQSGDTAPACGMKGTGGWTTSHACSALIATYTGVDTTTPLDGVTAAWNIGTGALVETAGVTTATNNAMAVSLAGRGDNEVFSTPTYNGSATGVTLRVNLSGTGGNDSQLGLFDKTITAAGATGVAQVSTSGTDPYGIITVSLKPSATGGSTSYGATALTVADTITTAAMHVKVGASSSSFAFSSTTEARAIKFAAASLTETVAITTAGDNVETHFGSTSLDLAAAATTAGQDIKVGSSASAYTFGAATAGQVGAFAASSSTVVFGATTAGVSSTPIHYGSSSSSVTVLLGTQTVGTVGAFSSLSMPIVATFTTDPENINQFGLVVCATDNLSTGACGDDTLTPASSTPEALELGASDSDSLTPLSTDTAFLTVV